MVATPNDYSWTSYHANAFGADNRLIRHHQEYLTLGSTPEERQTSYRALFKEAISDDRLKEIREHLQQQRALGTHRFQAAIEAELGRAARIRPRGRPQRKGL